MPWTELAVLVFLVAILVVALLVIGKRRMLHATRAELERLSAGAAIDLSSMHQVSFADLPDPVARYFRHVFVAPPQAAATRRYFQRGELRVDPKTKRWSRFTALYTVTENPPGFIWDARIEMAPLLHVRVRDSLIDGVGAGEVSLLSMIPLGRDRDVPELNTGALFRYLAEAVWHPTALLPEAGVSWQSVDDDRAVATLTVSGLSVSLEFRFNDIGEVVGIYTEDRFGRFDGKYIRYPWEGHFSDYREHDGVRIPFKGEVGWHLPDGWWLFWKGEIVDSGMGAIGRC